MIAMGKEEMGLRKIVPIIFFSVVVSVWLFSMLAVLIPLTNWGAPTFPLTIDANMKAIFVASTVLLASALFLMSMEKLGILSRINNLLARSSQE